MIRKLLFSALAALTLGLVGLGFGARTASAEVVANYWVDVVIPNPQQAALDNRCEPGTNPISLSGRAHYVWYTTPDGTLKMNIQAHLTGTDADGTEYVVNIQRHMEHWAPFPPIPPLPPAPIGPYTDTYSTNLISKGSTVNAQVVMTIDTLASPPIVTVTACRG